MSKLKLGSMVLTVLGGLLTIVTGFVDDAKQERLIEEKVNEKLNKKEEGS